MSIEFSEDNVTRLVLDRLSGVKEARFSEVMECLIRHLHGFVREVELTMTEWETAIDFLTRTGQICDDKRQEFILLSDTLGVSVLVDAMANRRPDEATENSVLGPFYRPHAPTFEMGADISGPSEGEPTLVRGRITDLKGNPIANALLDVWQADPKGLYENIDPDQPDMNLRGRFATGQDGRYAFRTIKPAGYPVPADGSVGELLTAMRRHNMRPAHIHFIVSADRFETVTTEIYAEDDEYLESDTVFGVKDSLVVDFQPLPNPGNHGLPEGAWVVNYDFKMSADC